MPHDANGDKLEVGDEVLLPCRVESICQTEDYCNVTAVAVLPAHPEGAYGIRMTGNSRQFIKTKFEIDDAPEARSSEA